MRDLLSVSCESASLAWDFHTSSHVSNLTRHFTRLSKKRPTSWNQVLVLLLLLLLLNVHDQLQVDCKEVSLPGQDSATSVADLVLLSSLPSNMQRYNNYSTSNTTSMSPLYSDTGYFGGQEAAGAFTMDRSDVTGTHDGRTTSQTTTTTTGLMANCSFTATTTSLDPSAGFPGLGELPSGGMIMDSPVDQNNMSGTFTGDLNSSAYDVADDHSQLLQEMLQQQSGQPGQCTQTSTPQGGGASASAWEDSLHVLQEMLLMQQQQQAQQIYQSQAEQVFSQAYSANESHHHGRSHTNTDQTSYHASGHCNMKGSSVLTTSFPGESELLSLLQLPRTSSMPTTNRGKGPLFSTSTIAGPVNTGEFFESRLGLSHGSTLHHGATQTAASFFHSLPRGGGGAGDFQSRQTGPILLDLDGHDRDVDPDGKASPFSNLKRGDGKGVTTGPEPRGVNHFATERQRREFLNEKYQTLRSLVPNPTKADRASIVADAIDYVKELKRTVQELQLLVQEKRRAAGGGLLLSGRKRSHRSMELLASDHGAAGGGGSTNLPGESTTDSASNSFQKGNDAYCSAVDGSLLRSSWLQRTSQTGTQVDVRIVHDEVTIKLTQRRRRNCLLDVFGVLLELHLDLLQASGASIGEHDVFLFNTKILEGSSTFAGYIAAKMLDAVDHRPLM